MISKLAQCPRLQWQATILALWSRNDVVNKLSCTQLDGTTIKVLSFFQKPPVDVEVWKEDSYLSGCWLRRIWKAGVCAHHVAVQYCLGNLSNWLHSSPEPCVALRVSDSPKLPLMLSGAVNWAWYTFVGPIKLLQTLIAFCRANMCTSDGPLWCKTPSTQTTSEYNDYIWLALQWCHLVKFVFAGSTCLEMLF